MFDEDNYADANISAADLAIMIDEMQEMQQKIEQQAKQIVIANYLILAFQKGFSPDSCKEELLEYEALSEMEQPK